MRTFKKIAVSLTAVTLLATAPAAKAQDMENLALMQTFLAIMSDYFEIIEATYEVSSSPEKSAIMQMQKIQEDHDERVAEAEAKALDLISEIEDEVNQ